VVWDDTICFIYELFCVGHGDPRLHDQRFYTLELDSGQAGVETVQECLKYDHSFTIAVFSSLLRLIHARTQLQSVKSRAHVQSPCFIEGK
jgi:hypothetical protein